MHPRNAPFRIGATLLRITSMSLLSLALAAPSVAGGYLRAGGQDAGKNTEKPTYATPAKRKDVEEGGSEVEILQSRLHNAELDVRESQQNATTAAYNLQRARTRRYPRGEELEKIRVLAEQTKKDRDEAEQALSALVTEARREGVPMGVLTHYMDLVEQIEAQRAEQAAGEADSR